MNLPPRTIGLKRLTVKDQPVLALDTGFAGDSLEGVRLVKASRGQGWFFHDGVLKPWVTKGVLQVDNRLVVWGDVDGVPEGTDPGSWPLGGAEGLAFVRAFVAAWTARSTRPGLPAFGPSAVVPWRTGEGWAFAFPPVELKTALDSLVPLAERLAWDHVRHPDLDGVPSWSFASAALGVAGVAGAVPWAQTDEEHLRQELRELGKTFQSEELPLGPDGTTLGLWSEALTGRSTASVDRWKAWAAEHHPWAATPGGPALDQARRAAQERRQRRRSGAAFWRRKGTLVTAGALALGVVLVIVGSVVWNAVKPNPTDTWTPEQVVKGYYAAYEGLDAEALKVLTRGAPDPTGVLARDQDAISNLYVIRQVRMAYERKSPVLPAQDWEAAGRPPLQVGQLLWGLAGLSFEAQGSLWTVRYHLWVTDGEGDGLKAKGETVVDQVSVGLTDRGWKISAIRRDRQPLP